MLKYMQPHSQNEERKTPHTHTCTHPGISCFVIFWCLRTMSQYFVKILCEVCTFAPLIHSHKHCQGIQSKTVLHNKCSRIRNSVKYYTSENLLTTFPLLMSHTKMPSLEVPATIHLRSCGAQDIE